MKRTFLSLLFLSSTTLFCPYTNDNEPAEIRLARAEQERAEQERNKKLSNLYTKTLTYLQRPNTQANRIEIAITAGLYNQNINAQHAHAWIASLNEILSRNHPVFFALMQNYAENFNNENTTTFTVEDPDDKSQIIITRQKNGTVENQDELNRLQESLKRKLVTEFRNAERANLAVNHVTKDIVAIHRVSQSQEEMPYSWCTIL